MDSYHYGKPFIIIVFTLPASQMKHTKKYEQKPTFQWHQSPNDDLQKLSSDVFCQLFETMPIPQKFIQLLIQIIMKAAKT